MEAVPRMPMIWLELKEAGDFHFSPRVSQYIKRSYGENPENYSEALRTLEKLRHSVVNLPRDFEGCNTLRKYFAQLHFLQSRVPMRGGEAAAAAASWTDIFTGKQVTHEDISYEQACVLYNLGALHSYLGSMDSRVSEEGMKTSCTHFQASAGAFTHIRDHYNAAYSSDLNHTALSININLMLAQAQECLLEKTLLDNRKNFLIARISAQVCDYYRESTRVLDSSDCVSGKKDWRKLLCMKISFFSAVSQLHMGKHCEEQQKHGEAVAYFQSALGKLNEAIKLSKSQPESVQEALKFTMDIIGGKFNSAKKDNDFIYHESVPGLDTLTTAKGASLVKPLPVSTTDPNITGPDLFSKLVPLAAHEASSIYSEEKAKLLREVMAKIDEKNRSLESFMNSLNCDAVDLDMFSSVPSALLEKCAALSVQPDAVKKLVQAMQALSSVYTDVGSYLQEVRNALEEDEAGKQTLLNEVGQKELPPSPAELTELQKEFRKYETAHQVASKTNTDLHKAMSQHIPNLRLLQGPMDELRNRLPQPQLTQDDTASLQMMKLICGKVDDMRKQRLLFEKELRGLIQKDDITTVLVITECADRKALIEEQLQKYSQLKGYIDQNLAAQENIIKALTEANVKCASIRKTLSVTQKQWNSSVLSMVASYDAYEDLVKKAEEGKSFYQDMEKKTSSLLEKVKTICQSREEARKALMKREVANVPPPRPAARKPVPASRTPGLQSGTSIIEPSGPSSSPGLDVPQKPNSLPPNMALAKGPPLHNFNPRGPTPFNWAPGGVCPQFLNQGVPQVMPTIPPPNGQVSGLPHPVAPIQPSLGYPQFQPGPPGGMLPVPPHIYPQNMPHQGYMPASWQNLPGVPGFTGSANYTAPPEIGPTAARPAGNVLTCGGQGQHMQSSVPHYQGFPPQPAHGVVSQAPRGAVFGQSHPSTHPRQFQPQAPMSHVLPSIPSSQTKPMPRSLPNVNKPTDISQTTNLVAFNHNQPMDNLYFQGVKPYSQVQPLPALNTCQQPTMFQTGNPLLHQPLRPQNSSTSGPVPASVMDNPNPPANTAILTPSSAQPSPLKSPSSENSLSVLQDKVKQLSITSQHEASDCGEDKGK